MERKTRKRVSAFQMQCTEVEQTETSSDINKGKGDKNTQNTSGNRRKTVKNDDRKQSSNTDGHYRDNRRKNISRDNDAIGQAQSDGFDSAKKRKSFVALPVDGIGTVKEKKSLDEKRKSSAKKSGSVGGTKTEIRINRGASCSVGAYEEIDLDQVQMQIDDEPEEIQTVDINKLKISGKQLKSKSNTVPGKVNIKENTRLRKGKSQKSIQDVDLNRSEEVKDDIPVVKKFVRTSTIESNDGESSDNEGEASQLDMGYMNSDHAWYFCVKTDNSVLVIVRHPAEFVLKGKAAVQCLSGTVSILGYDLIAGSSCVDVFSPDSHSLLTLITKVGCTNVQSAIKPISKCLGSSKNWGTLEKNMQKMKSFVVLKFRKLETRFCEYIKDIVPYTDMFWWNKDGGTVNKKLRSVGLSLHLPDSIDYPYMRVPAELQQVLDMWSSAIGKKNADPAVMLVCGGKDSGKSTTSRMLINASLSRLESVYYLECDVGQTEFTPPGIVSLLKVTTPVLGPPFCHQRVPVCSYMFGGLSPADDPNSYMRCVHLCVQHYQQLQTTTPLIVNTMGWMRGLGLKLLVDTVRLVTPSHIVQLQSEKKSQYGEPLSEEFYQQTSWTDVSRSYSEKLEDFSIQRKRRNPHIVLLSASSPTGCPKLRPVEHRDLNVLSYLSGNLDPGMTLTSMAPYCISWTDVAVYVTDIPMSQVWNTLNGCLVALCLANLKQAEMLSDDGPLFFRRLPSCRWIGYGIVRGVDLDRKVVVIATALDMDSLSCVNTLVKGAVNLPEHLLKDQACGDLPYVADTLSGVGTGAVKPRKYMPRSVHDT